MGNLVTKYYKNVQTSLSLSSILKMPYLSNNRLDILKRDSFYQVFEIGAQPNQKFQSSQAQILFKLFCEVQVTDVPPGRDPLAKNI